MLPTEPFRRLLFATARGRFVSRREQRSRDMHEGWLDVDFRERTHAYGDDTARGAALKPRTFKFQGRDVEVSRYDGLWRVTADGNTTATRRLDTAMENVLGRPGLPGTPHGAFVRLAVEILGQEREPPRH